MLTILKLPKKRGLPKLREILRRQKQDSEDEEEPQDSEEEKEETETAPSEDTVASTTTSSTTEEPSEATESAPVSTEKSLLALVNEIGNNFRMMALKSTEAILPGKYGTFFVKFKESGYFFDQQILRFLYFRYILQDLDRPCHGHTETYILA